MTKQKSILEKINPKIKRSLQIADTVLGEYDLCEYCTGRLFAKNFNSSNYKALGKKIHGLVGVNFKTKCFICKNIFSQQNDYVRRMLDLSSSYQFSTFLIGAILRPSAIDRDDIIRSKFRLRGTDSLKTSITRELSKKFSRISKTKNDLLNPDLTITINFRNDSFQVRTKSLFLFGKYQKTVRGINQKQKACVNCRGRGCTTCKFHGITDFESVEGKICRFLFDEFGALQAKITWIGGEDKTSLVLGQGRPFFVKLVNPKLRKRRIIKNQNLNGVTIKLLKIIDKTPKTVPTFKSVLDITVNTEKPINSKYLKKLKNLKKSSILVNERFGKQHQKLIYELKYRKNSSNSFILSITVDGGLPLRRFVEGKNVNPNLSELLGNKCICTNFDFHKIELLN